MKASANEVMALAATAARGAGAPPGQAAAFGRAAARHLAAGRASEDLLAALSALPAGPIVDVPLALRRAAEAIADGAGAAPLTPEGPLIQSYVEADPALVVVAEEPLLIGLSEAPKEPAPPPARVAIPDELWAHLKALASRTQVPETEASRRSGAGAGLTDND